MSTYRDRAPQSYTCVRCGKTVKAKLIVRDVYIPVDGHLIWHTSGEIVLCLTCSRNSKSWTWWAEFDLDVDAAYELALMYDANYEPHDIPPSDRCWS